MDNILDWAREQAAYAEFGDLRRTNRFIEVLRRAAEAPAGQLTRVFTRPAELQAAYNFMEGAVPPRAIIDAFASATLAALDQPSVYVVVDGTSLSLTDRSGVKDFGSVGVRSLPTRGLKVIDAVAVSERGVPAGLLDLHFWARLEKSQASRFERRRDGDTEVRHWLDVIAGVKERALAAGVRPHFIIDREADCADMLRAVAAEDGEFTIRAGQYGRLCVDGTTKRSLLQTMRRSRVVATRDLHVPRSAGRPPRVASLEIRHARVVLDLPDRHAGTRVRTPLEVSVVWARERRPPRGQERLDWMLFTSTPIGSRKAAAAVLDRYCLRWRVEDFHRTWKQGRCCVEDTQLRNADHVIRWATMLASVALRIERLKHLARTEPDSPASVELKPMELDALRAVKAPASGADEMPTIRVAVRWIAEMGGFHGPRDKDPGAQTLGRGLERLLVFAQGFALGRKVARK